MAVKICEETSIWLVGKCLLIFQNAKTFFYLKSKSVYSGWWFILYIILTRMGAFLFVGPHIRLDFALKVFFTCD